MSPGTLFDRPLPTDTQAEQFVLGALMSDENAYAPVAELLEASDFGLEKHKLIFLRIQGLHEAGIEVSCTTVARALHEREQLQSADGLSYLVSLPVTMPVSALSRLSEQIRHTAIRRRGIQAAAALIEDLYSNTPATELLTSAEKVTGILDSESARRLKVRTFEDIVNDAGGINEFLNAPHKRPGTPIPFADIHATLSGLRRGKLLLVAARPGVGKSAWVHQCMLHADRLKRNSLLVTLEMSGEDMMYRELTAMAQVSAYKFREGKLGYEDRVKLVDRTSQLVGLGRHCLILDEPIRVNGIGAILRSLKAQGHEIENVFVDYLQLLEPDASDNRVQEVSQISRDLKLLTQEYDVHVCAISNLSRKASNGKEVKATDEPQLDWLRDSGQLEYDADQVLFFWLEREITDGEPLVPVNWKVAKLRDGIKNEGTLMFHSKYCRFEGADEPDAAPSAYSGKGNLIEMPVYGD